MKPLFASTLLSLALLSLNPAHADTLSMTTSDVTASPSGQAIVNFTLDFGSGLSVTSFDGSLNYDSHLNLVNAAATYNGTPVDVFAALGALGSYGSATAPGSLTMTWMAWDAINSVATPPLNLTGTATFSFTFMAAKDTKKAPVTFSIDDYSDANLDVYGPVAATSLVTAVPEPETWALLAAGLGLMGGVARRKGAARA